MSEIVTEPFEEVVRGGGALAIQYAGHFFMRDDPVHQALHKIARKFDELGVAYAVAGGMALVAHGYERTTVDIDVLVTEQGLATIHRELEGLGYVAPFKGSKHLRDVQNGVRVEFLVTGQFPGDGKPKPVPFPDPEAAGAEIDGIRYLKLASLIELKLASGMTNPGRIKDLADVQELIRVLGLSADFAQQLSPYVRDKFAELWSALQQDRPDAV